MPEVGRLLVILGIFVVLVGLVFMLGARIPLLGRLPGDISLTRGNTRIYFPLATSIVLSLVLTLLLNLFFRGR